MPVELREASERDVRHVHVQPHADRVGRDEIVDEAVDLDLQRAALGLLERHQTGRLLRLHGRQCLRRLELELGFRRHSAPLPYPPCEDGGERVA